MKLAWNNIKGDFNSEPNMLEFVKENLEER